MKFNRELLKGHLKPIILSIFNDGPCHAYAFNQKLEDKSLGVFSIAEGTIYPSLHKLEKEGMIESKWETRDNKPNVKVYSITTKGKKFLEESAREWSFFSRAMNMLLEKLD